MVKKNQVKGAILNFGVRIRAGILTSPLIVLALTVIACELGGIWPELKGIRREQETCLWRGIKYSGSRT
jgi:hypothetical protein